MQKIYSRLPVQSLHFDFGLYKKNIKMAFQSNIKAQNQEQKWATILYQRNLTSVKWLDSLKYSNNLYTKSPFPKHQIAN